MRKLLTYILFLLTFGSVYSQKITVGAEIPSVRSLKDDIVWLNGKPDGDRFKIYDFYQSENSSCISNIERLKLLIKNRENQIEGIILTRESGSDIHELAKSLDGKLYVGIDTTENGYFVKCYVKYLPYTMLVDDRNKLLWHGFMKDLTKEIIAQQITDDQL